jgi:chromosome segregation protein
LTLQFIGATIEHWNQLEPTLRFSRLRLNGFKSFVDPTDLVIMDGLTGVVGPNGCGKSNLLEALRWVMGENRASAMRGGGMEDVIFAGAATRPARSFAEVTLVIDNSDRVAPSGFNEADQIEIIRRITRDAGSAYKVNAKDVRARDVQMLFADASTGAHSPALVRQGQIAELINAKPKNRRRILEEAAGISGLYQRRHEAELRLVAAENNLVRVDDVLESLVSQLATLARQARQASRYREIGTELRRAEGMLLFRRWREADLARQEAEEILRARVLTASQAETAVRLATTTRQTCEDLLPPKREEEAVASAILQRLTVQRDALGEQENRARQMIETLRGRIDQLTCDAEREASLNRDAHETIGRLQWEDEQLLRAHDGHEAKLSQAAESAREAAATLSEREVTLSERTEDVARLAARHQSTHRILTDSRAVLERAEAEAVKAYAVLEEARLAQTDASSAFSNFQNNQAEAMEVAAYSEEALAIAEEERATVQNAEAESRAARSAVEGEANALRAEVVGLTKLIDREAQSGTQVLDLLKVDLGYEAALGAALADDLRAPILADGGMTGWIDLAPYETEYPLPKGAAPLAQYVKVPDPLRRRIGQIGLVTVEMASALQKKLLPGQRLVSLRGDLWRWDGFCTGAGDAPSATALRLQQLNRLVELNRDLEEIGVRAQGAGQAHELLQGKLAEVARADQAARDARRAADQQVTEANRAASHAEANYSIASGKLEAAELSVKRFDDDSMAAIMRLTEAEASAKDLGDLVAARAQTEDLKVTVEAARSAMMTLRLASDELRREGEARVRRLQDVTKEMSGWKYRLEMAETRGLELSERKIQTQEELLDAGVAPENIAIKHEELTEAMAKAEDRRRRASDALAEAEIKLRVAFDCERDAQRIASEAREARARTEAHMDAARDTLAYSGERVREEMDCTPQDLLERLAANPDAMPDAGALDIDVNRLKRQRESLGAVNLRAEEDAKTVQEEFDDLNKEKQDLEGAIKTLRSGISGLNKEGRERLLLAFEQVNASFGNLFTHLFGGGEARLVLVENDDPLEAGLEIMCQPPGKKLAVLSLLSGGEQTLTAMALIFAVFLANPAPICVLDEVDAPLDDANVARFCDLLDEMARRTKTRFLVITHHAVTMARMNRLFGVTMGEQGVSQLVSVDLKKAESLVA